MRNLRNVNYQNGSVGDSILFKWMASVLYMLRSKIKIPNDDEIKCYAEKISTPSSWRLTNLKYKPNKNPPRTSVVKFVTELMVAMKKYVTVLSNTHTINTHTHTKHTQKTHTKNIHNKQTGFM